MYDHILLPTDGSERARGSAAEAVELAALTGATLHVLYVVDTRDYNTLPESKWLHVREELESEGQEAVDEVRTMAAEAGVPVETAIERGLPHEEILSYAADNDVDLVVMGTHGRSGIDRFLLGSVTEKVIRGATVPVHVIRVDET